jgi:hypothetical protein
MIPALQQQDAVYFSTQTYAYNLFLPALVTLQDRIKQSKEQQGNETKRHNGVLEGFEQG